MPQIIHTDQPLPHLDRETQLWVYNGFDCAVTHQVLSELESSQTEASRISYSFVMAMRAPALEMMERGIRIDMETRWKLLDHYQREAVRLQEILNRIAQTLWDKPLNPSSPKQKVDFLYGVLKLPPQVKSFKGVKRISTDRDCLEKLLLYFQARPIVRLLLSLSDVNKTISVLKSGVDEDKRIRCSYNIAGTETGRWSSSKNVRGTGMNLQNVAPRLRKMFISDDGMKLAYVDLEQAESRTVAYLSGDEKYIEACESADLHTTVARMVWPELGWTGMAQEDRQVADTLFYREFSYRDLAKRGGHGTNYLGQAFTMSRFLKIDQKVMEKFQSLYFRSFPKIKTWHQSIARQLQLDGWIETPLGRRRYFFGRLGDDSTLREAVAFVPQSVIGEFLNLLLWRVWKNLRVEGVKILAQVHDAILIQYPQEKEDTLLPLILSVMKVPIPVLGREMIIPSEAKVGWNWGNEGKDNPDGLRKWKSQVPDTRTRQGNPSAGVMDWKLS